MRHSVERRIDKTCVVVTALSVTSPKLLLRTSVTTIHVTCRLSGSVSPGCDVVLFDVRTDSRTAQHEEPSNVSTSVPMTSQYLHVTEPSTQPPLAVFSTKSAAVDKLELNRLYSVERRTSPTDRDLGASSLEATTPHGDHSYMNETLKKKAPQQSRSVDNLSHYVGMSGDSADTNRHLYANNGAEASGLYSYARTFDLTLPLAGVASSSKNGNKSKLKKTSSIPTILDGAPSSSAMVADTGGCTRNDDDYVPASPPLATVSDKSASDAGATSRVSDTTSSPASDIVSPGGSMSAALLSPDAGISMSSRSRVFTRQK